MSVKSAIETYSYDQSSSLIDSTAALIESTNPNPNPNPNPNLNNNPNLNPNLNNNPNLNLNPNTNPKSVDESKNK
jgi:hypothetical protein